MTRRPPTSTRFVFCSFFFFNDTATTEIYTLSLHDALPISNPVSAVLRVDHSFGHEFAGFQDRKSTRLNSSHVAISYAVFCLKKKKFYLQLALSKQRSGGQLIFCFTDVGDRDRMSNLLAEHIFFKIFRAPRDLHFSPTGPFFY